MDGNDYDIWEAVDVVDPEVVVIEYNGKFPPDVEWKMAYDRNHMWNGTDWHGASLKALQLLGEKKGYQLVGTGLNGANAFLSKGRWRTAGFMSLRQPRRSIIRCGSSLFIKTGIRQMSACAGRAATVESLTIRKRRLRRYATVSIRRSAILRETGMPGLHRENARCFSTEKNLGGIRS